MARSKKQKIEINSNSSLQGVMQEVYNNACNQIQDAQKVVNELTASITAVDVDDITKVAKAKTDALKVKDSAIKIKLDVGKLQNDIMKYSGNMDEVITNNNSQLVTSDNFSEVREMIKNADKQVKND
jgi:hypothetical protein